MIHTSNAKPKIFPILADDGPAEIDRLQELSSTMTLNMEKVREIGRDGIVDWRKGIPNVSLTGRQLEYGSIEFWRKLANKGSTVNTIQLTDFKTSTFDIAAYKTDDNGTFLGTVYYPSLRISGFNLSIGDPAAAMERSFTFVGEDQYNLQGTNKYLIYKRATVAAGANQTVTLNDPSPVSDPDDSGAYLFRVTRSRGGATTELTHGNDWSYDGASLLTINGVSQTGDVIRVWYSAGAYISGQSIFDNNDADLASIPAENVSVFLQSSNYLYRLQSVAIDSTFDRQDTREIGNRYVVSRGIKEVTNRITLGKMLENYDLEEILRGRAGIDYAKIDPRNFTDGLNLIVKVYTNSLKTNFLMGYKFYGLAPTNYDTSIPLNDYITANATLEGESGFITTIEGVL